MQNVRTAILEIMIHGMENLFIWTHSFHQSFYVKALIHAALFDKDANSKEDTLYLPLLLDTL